MKRQLEDAAAWDTSAAVAAVTAASAAEAANGAKGRGAPSVDEEELEELRDKIEELQVGSGVGTRAARPRHACCMAASTPGASLSQQLSTPRGFGVN